MDVIAEFYFDVGSPNAYVVRGVFGSPSLTVSAELYFRRDRKRRAEETIEAQRKRSARGFTQVRSSTHKGSSP